MARRARELRAPSVGRWAGGGRLSAGPEGLAADLLSRGEDDATAAAALLAADGVPDAIVCFHAQQAVQKAIKAVLARHGVEFPFTHDIALLIELLEDAGGHLPMS